MTTLTYRRTLILVSCLAIATLSGCTDGPLGGLASYSPFASADDPADLAKYGPTPQSRIDSLRSLASQADRMNASDREATSLELVEQFQQEPDPSIRAQIARTLGSFPTPTAAATLVEATKDRDSLVRIAACDTWGTAGSPESVQLLGEVLAGDTDIDVRLAAARALGNFQEPSAVRALSIALDDPDPSLQYRAVQSLKLASGRDYGNNLIAWRRYADGEDLAEPDPPSMAERVRDWF